jgi:hypothetical protein
MAREYSTSGHYSEHGSMFEYQKWLHGRYMHPLHIFSAICRTQNPDMVLAKAVILSFKRHERTCRVDSRTQDWGQWFLEELSFDALELKGLTKKMQMRIAKAYGTAHEATSGYLKAFG